MKLVNFDMPLNHTVVDDVAKSVVIKVSDDKGCNYHVGNIGRQWQFVIIYDQYRKTLPKGQMHREIIVRCQPKGWITSAGIGVEQQDGPEKTGCWSWMLLRDI